MTTNTELAIEYQKGDQAAAKELLSRFEPLLKKFTNLIYHGIYDLHDNHIRSFLELFISSNNDYSIENIDDVMNTIKTLNRDYDYEDIMQDLKLVFLNILDDYDYNVNKSDFDGYLFVYFKYYLKKYLNNDQSPFSITISNINYGHNRNSYEEKLNFLLKENKLNNDLYSINDNWVEGSTCGNLFSDLTEYERSILKYYYVDGLTLDKIGEKMNKDKSTISRRIYKVKTELFKRL